MNVTAEHKIIVARPGSKINNLSPLTQIGPRRIGVIEPHFSLWLETDSNLARRRVSSRTRT
jgi:hypothetical protein